MNLGFWAYLSFEVNKYYDQKITLNAESRTLKKKSGQGFLFNLKIIEKKMQILTLPRFSDLKHELQQHTHPVPELGAPVVFLLHSCLTAQHPHQHQSPSCRSQGSLSPKSSVKAHLLASLLTHIHSSLFSFRHHLS